jgi:response regulator RpfG family c-di-GMP phosphodiesterase
VAKILVVDDHAPNRQFLFKLLGYGGHEVLEAADGREGLRVCRAERPDLVISDILMPTMDGYEFVRQLRDEPATAQMVVIFFTATYHQRAAAALAQACGVVHLLNKPSKPDEILKVVHEALGHTPPPMCRPPAEDFRREHLTLLTDTLSQKVAELETVNRRLERRLQHLAALRNIDLAILSSLDLRVTLNVILDQTTTQLGTDAAAILLLDPERQFLEYAAVRGFRHRAPARSPLRSQQGYASRAVSGRLPVRVPDLAAADEADPSTFLPADEGFLAYFAEPLIAKGQVKGVLEVFHRTPLAPDAEWLEFLEALAGQAAIAIDSARMVQGLQRSNAEVAQAYDATLEGWVRALDLRDRETEGHTQRVTEGTLELARAMGLDNGALTHIRRGALLHDIGKIGIPDRILLKPGPLTEAEWEIMRRHPLYAYQMLAPIGYLRNALDIPYCHHERWNGTGYPRGLKQEQIPLAARMFAVVDVWDALTFDRPYRAAWPRSQVLIYIREQAGKQFDPKVVEAFTTFSALGQPE